MSSPTTTVSIRYRRDRPGRPGGYVLRWQSPAMAAPAFEEYSNRPDAARAALSVLFRTPARAWRVECLTAPGATGAL